MVKIFTKTDHGWTSGMVMERERSSWFKILDLFLFRVFFISLSGMLTKHESFCGSNLRLPVLVVHAHTLPTGAGLTVPPAIPVQPMVLQMAGRHDAGGYP